MKLIALSGKSGKGLFTQVDDDKFDFLNQWKWHLTKRGYVRRTGYKNGIAFSMLMHRIIMGDPEGIQVDHQDGNKFDNRKINLRLCNNSQNNQNRFIQSNNTTGYKGIEKHLKKQKWRAKLALNKKRYYSKYYDSKIEAAKEYDRLARKYFGEFARTNF